MGWRDRAIVIDDNTGNIASNVGAQQSSPSAPSDWRSRAQPVPTMPIQADKTDASSALLQGFGQGGTLGYLPQLQAAGGMAAQSLAGDGQDTYDSLKKYFQNRNEQLKTEHPLASTAGNIAGAAMTLPGLGEAEGLSLLAKTGRSALTGAAYGGAANPEVESTDADPYAALRARLKNAGIGAVAGGITESMFGNTGQGISKAGENLSNKTVVKQIGGNAGQIKKILQKDEIPRIEGFLQNENLMIPGKSVDDVAKHTGQILEDDGPKIGILYQNAQDNAAGMGKEAPKISGPALADDIVNSAKDKFKNHANRDQIVKEMENSVGPLRDMGDNANITDIHDYRKSLDENIDWSKSAKERPAVQNAYINARNIVADKAKDTIGQLDQRLGSDQVGLLNKLNDRYSTASTVNNISNQAVARETAKAFLGTGALGAGAGGGAAYLEYQRTHDPLKAIGVGAATALGVTAARKFGNPLGYYTGKGMQGLGEGIEAITPSAMGVGAAATSPWINMQSPKKDNKNGR